MSLESAFHGRLVLGAVLSSATGGLVLLLTLLSAEALRFFCALAAWAALSAGRVMCLAAVRRTPPPPISTLRLSPRVLLELLALVFLSLGCCLSAAALGESESWAMAFVLALVAQIRQPGRTGLRWDHFPQEAVHRKVKARLPWIVGCSALMAVACMTVTSLLLDSSFSWWPWFVTGLVVFSSVGLQEILMEGSTWHALDKDELLEALTQPLSCEGPGLSRWLAMATLARAIVTKHQGHGHAAWLPESQLPPMAAQVFGLSKAGSAAALQADGRSFFAVYLQSGLEVLREFTIRAQCIVTYSWRSPKTLDLAQMQVLEAQVLQLAPLMRMASAGLSGWISLSRDVDEMGVVQREESLSKVIYELCGALQALQRLSSLRGVLDYAASTAAAVQSTEQEVQLSLQQLLITFEHFGLQQVKLPPLYKRMLEDLAPLLRG